jgi:hypothetical protein
MPLWGNKNQPVTVNSTTTFESTKGAPIGTYVHVKGGQVTRRDGANAHFGNNSPGSRADVDFEMFNSQFFGEFMPNLAVGVYGVYANSGDLKTPEPQFIPVTTVVNDEPEGELITFTLVNGGGGYSQGTAFKDVPILVTFANGYSSFDFISGKVQEPRMGPTPGAGSIISLNTINPAYDDEVPFVDVTPPEVFLISANSNQLAPEGINIYYAVGDFAPGSKLFYGVPEGNTAIAPLTGNTYYYAGNCDFNVLRLRETPDGPEIRLTDPRINSQDQTPEQHSFQGEQAQVIASIPNPKNIGAAHAGWVLQKEFKGGRAGRTQTEVLVAMSSLEEGVIPPIGHRPDIYTVVPARGTIKGGDTIEITGKNFIAMPNRKKIKNDDTKVFFGTVESNNVTVVNGQYIVAESPAVSKAMTTDVVVVTTDGGSRVGPNTKFTYIVTEPYVVDLNPDKGGFLGGDTVQIVGANFTNITDVYFGNTRGTILSNPDADHLIVDTPRVGMSMNVDVKVVSSDHGNSDPNPATKFQFYDARAVIFNITPANSGLTGGRVDITGVEFQGTYKVYFGDTEAQFTYVNSTFISANSPATSKPGVVDVILTDNYGNSAITANSKFTYYSPLPVIESITPNTISTWNRQNIVIRGQNLWYTSEVSWDRLPYISTNTEIVNINGSVITVSSPVTNSDGITTSVYVTTPSGRSTGVYNVDFVKIPFIQDLSIHEDDYRGGTNVTATGINFLGATEVGMQRLGVKIPVINFRVENNTCMYFTTPAVEVIANNYYAYVVGPKGSTIPGGDSGAYFHYSTYTPQITNITPNTSPVRGGSRIKVDGKNFNRGVTQVRFGEGPSGTNVNSFQIVNDTLMYIWGPPASAGVSTYLQIVTAKYGNSSVGSNSIIRVSNNTGTINNYVITKGGSGYSGNRTNVQLRSFSPGSFWTNDAIYAVPKHDGQVNTASQNGQITTYVVNANYGEVYTNAPICDILPPEKYTFPANSSGFNTDGFALWGAYQVFSKGDKVYYEVPYGNTAFAPLTGNTWYYVAENQLYFLKVSTSPGGPAISITDPRKTSTAANVETHFLQGETATMIANLVP